MIEQQKHDLSERQMAILIFIHDYQTMHGFVPSIREIAKGTDTSSTSVVSYHINRLVELGYVSKVNDVSRGISLLAPAYAVVGAAVPETVNLSMIWDELLALRTENQRIHELYKARVTSLEAERNRLSQTLSILKLREMKEAEPIS